MSASVIAPVATAATTAVVQHTYAAPGTYTVSLIATDTGGFVSAPATASVAVVAMMEVRVPASSDDAEETSAGAVSLTSSDLELVFDSSSTGNQTIGLRFAGMAAAGAL